MDTEEKLDPTEKKELFLLSRVEPYKAMDLEDGRTVLVMPNPCELDCPDCLYCHYCTHTLGMDSRKLPCDNRPDDISCVYFVLDVVNRD